MKRRDFFRLSAIAALLPAAFKPAIASNTDIRQLSSNEDAPGFREWCILNGDGKVATIYLDGVEQKWVDTVDADGGFIVRTVETPEGNMAHSHEYLLKEKVFGKVDIVIAARG